MATEVAAEEVEAKAREATVTAAVARKARVERLGARREGPTADRVENVAVRVVRATGEALVHSAARRSPHNQCRQRSPRTQSLDRHRRRSHPTTTSHRCRCWCRCSLEGTPAATAARVVGVERVAARRAVGILAGAGTAGGEGRGVVDWWVASAALAGALDEGSAEASVASMEWAAGATGGVAGWLEAWRSVEVRALTAEAWAEGAASVVGL